MAAQFRVKALYDYSSPHEDDLTFDAGQVIAVTAQEDEDWYEGEYMDANGAKQEGIFPRNFVEKVEPTAPPRPVRTRTKKESSEAPKSPEAVSAPAPVAPTAPAEPEPAPFQEPEPESEPEHVEPEEPIVKSPPPQPAAPVPAAAPTKPVERPTAAPAAVEKPKESAAAAPPPKAKAFSPPPPVSDKPLSNSFKDRIAAFNKPAAPPVTPFKPSGLTSGGGSSGGTGFIKKPFVAAPPSRNSYVPPPQQAPVSKVYRRDEDPEIREKEEENLEQAEKAGLAPTEVVEGDDEDQPKPTTLKERIALLQQQQREQAQRHAEPAVKKEKPKKPPPKKPEPAPVAPEEPFEEEEEELEVEPSVPPALPPALPRRSTEDSGRRSSTDDARAHEPPPPRRKSSRGHALESIHDGNEADMSGAGDTTEGQDDTTEREDDEPARQVPKPPMGMAQPPPQVAPEKQPEKEEDEEEGDEDDEDVDPEVKRKEELRARMAKMSGGMGFHGMFGMGPPGGPAPPKKKTSKSSKTESTLAEESEEEPTSPMAAPPVPAMIPVPGMGGPPPRKSMDSTRSEEYVAEPTPATRAVPPPPVPSRQAEPDEYDDEDDETTPALTPAASATHPPPPVPGGRPAPPPVPSESRPPPPGPPGALQSQSEGSESGDEMSTLKEQSLDSGSAQPPPPQLPPMPPQPAHAPELPIRYPNSPGGDEPPIASPTATQNKRLSRAPPPIPGSAPAPPPSSSRPPPPPPPGPGSVSRQSTADVQIPPMPIPARPPQAGEENESEATEYEGDYDTDIGSGVHHKDALKAHARDSSQEENSLQSPTDAPQAIPPPIPLASAPRAVPPPLPSQPPPPPAESKRRSVDVPRAAPPPPPPTREPLSPSGQSEDYDPYNYSAITPGLSKKTPRIEEEAYFPDSQAPQAGRPAPQTMPSARSRQSLDVGRKSMSARRSMDAPRPTGESGFIAEDIELAEQSGWWKQANQVPPVLQGRRDIFYECDESTTTNGGAKTEITREIWILFQDYSQTILTVRYDPYDPTDVDVEQRHEPPPRPLRQDQMEDFYERFGRPISEAAASKKDTVVGDGTPQGLILELLGPHKDALPPVGTRAFGALVYSNMANASTSQNDAIRPGDIISIRNAKFQGKHGAMHAKYSVEVGKPDHVGVVAEWDGTKKKVRAWEQGRESKKVKMESFKLDDLRSGEVRIWRVMPRGWVGWDSQA